MNNIEEYLSHRKNKQHKEWVCAIDGEIKYSAKSLYNHNQNHHSNKEKFKCVTCPETYSCMQNLKNHLNSPEGKECRLNCGIAACPDTFEDTR